MLEREFRKNKRQNIVIKEDTVPQEKSFDIEPAWIKKCDFPDENTPDTLFNGVRFADLPIVHIRVSKNNTIYMLTDSKGNSKEVRSCGIEGFLNTKKGTNIAAQATAISFSTRLLRKGFSQVRVSIRGLGPGRMASIKGLEMGGLDIISITDRTPVMFGGNRPRKQRRL
ncbi:28S ribosomal protein S11, mitochondrial [Araneus ventricosus]|uniref:28S ribosomal protein S11, mitochondrial n=1 Tax=Araneus ventricosus TaxID=182803 RepID=A0A4Y2KAB9_ARAVE|nr:28S ribosomal protein S11, mitochondrial [Araneus ventricosus]